MTSVLGDVLEDTGSLPDWVDAAETTTLPDSEDMRILQLYNAAIIAHFACALGKDTGSIKDNERDYSRRVLTFTWGEWAETRKFLCSCADLDEAKVRRAAIAAIEKADRAQGRDIEPAKITKPAPRIWTGTELLAWIESNEAGLREIGELDIAIDEAARRETMAHRPENSRDQRYMPTDISAIAAE